MPRWKDDEDRGEFGAWLSAQVGDRTFDWLAHEMAAEGHTHGADYYRAMASGNKPPGRVIGRALRKYFGAPATSAPARLQATETPDPLIAALRDLATEIRLSRAEEAVTRQEMMRAIAALAGGRVLRETPVGDERGTPEGAAQ